MIIFLRKLLVLIPKDKLLKIILTTIAGTLLILLIVIAIPGSLFTYIPLAKDEVQYNYYINAANEIEKKTGLYINHQELMAVDAVLLAQDFNKSSQSRANMIAEYFYKSEWEEYETTCIVQRDQLDSKGKPVKDSKGNIIKTNVEVTCTKEKLVYSNNTLDEAINLLVTNRIANESQRELIKRYTIYDTSIISPSKNILLPSDWLPNETTYLWAVPGVYNISSHFGSRLHPIQNKWKSHNGFDIPASTGTRIVAIADGKVTTAQEMGTAGLAVIIQHQDDTESRYYHMSYIAVKKNQEVKKGEYIGKVGSTGGSTGPHLHLEIRKSSTPVDPFPYYK